MKLRSLLLCLVSSTLVLAAPGCESGKIGKTPRSAERAQTQNAGERAPAPEAEGPRSTQPPRERPKEKQFDVDPAMLGFAVSDSALGIRLAPPRGWPPLESDLLEASRKALAQIQVQQELFASRPVRIWNEKERRLFMIVSEFPNWPAPLDPYSAFLQYRQTVQSRIPDLQIQDGFFSHGKLDFYEILLSNPVMINTRVMVIRQGRPPIQVDYLMPRAVYESQEKAIEASIGSIEPL